MYYLKKDGLIYGPYEADVLRKRAAEGFISPSDTIKREDGPWFSASKIKNLFQTKENEHGIDQDKLNENKKNGSITTKKEDANTSQIINNNKKLKKRSEGNAIFEVAASGEKRKKNQQAGKLKSFIKKKAIINKILFFAISIFLGILIFNSQLINNFTGIISGSNKGFEEKDDIGNRLNIIGKNIMALDKADKRAANPLFAVGIKAVNVNREREKYIVLEDEMAVNGYDIGPIGNYLNNFIKYGNSTNAEAAKKSNREEEIFKQATGWREKLKGKFFKTAKFKFIIPSSQVFDKGELIFYIELPFKLPNGIPVENGFETEGNIIKANCRDIVGNQFGFLNKNGTVTWCRAEDTDIIKSRGGFIYLSECPITYIKLTLKGDSEQLKLLYNNKFECGVECGFTDLKIEGDLHIGYFRLDKLQKNGMNTDELKLNKGKDLFGNPEAPSYVQNNSVSTCITAQIRFIEVKDHKGQKVGTVYFK